MKSAHSLWAEPLGGYVSLKVDFPPGTLNTQNEELLSQTVRLPITLDRVFTFEEEITRRFSEAELLGIQRAMMETFTIESFRSSLGISR